MPTLLTNRKMAPELAARIEARLHGRRVEVRKGLPPLVVSVFRFVALTVIVTAATLLILAIRRDRQALAHDRQLLLEKVRAEAAVLTEEDFGISARVEAWLVRVSGPYEGDFVAKELEAPGALTRTLERPAIYVRGEIGSLSTPAGIRASAMESQKDPLLLCLVDPPPARTEKAQLRKVYAAYAGGARAETPTSHVRRLAEAQVGLTFLLPAWRDQIADADRGELDLLKSTFERAPIDFAKRAAQARLLIVGVDEPGDARGVTELDGERPHPMRVAIVDLATDKALLRIRRTVDPKWISAAKRPDYARGLDSCALALDVHDSVTSPATAAKSADE